MNKRWLGIVLVSVAQAGFSAAPTAVHLTLDAVKPVKVSAAKGASAVIVLKIKPGFHIQANPTSQPNLVPTTVALETDDKLEIGQPVYPPGKNYRLKGSDRDILTYEGKTEIQVPITLKGSAAAGKSKLKGKLRYQACDDAICYFPKSEDFTVSVERLK